MALTLRNIKRWFLMLTGQSIYHVNQSNGEFYNKTKLHGYYNNMMEKVLRAPEYINTNEMPYQKLGYGKIFYFPVGVFQYAFGLLDLFYKTGEQKYKDKFKHCADWALKKQLESGAWDNFSYYYPQNPYGAMAQGQGASLLIRAYEQFKDKEYVHAAKKAIDFMIVDIKDGGCTLYSKEDVIFLEYPHRKAVMNGWIFSWWGLYDYVLVTQDNSHYKELLDKSCNSLINTLPLFCKSYWSMYDLENRISSPFYHNLHIAQMQAMYNLTGEQVFDDYAKQWARQQKNLLCQSVAFIKKSIQKIME